MNKVQQEVNHLYKNQYGKLVAFLLHLSKEMDLEMAEDIVQDAFSSALTRWKGNEIPVNAVGWIFRVCRNKALNKLKKEKKVRLVLEHEEFPAPGIETARSFFDDEQLRLLFACAHPDLSPKVQVVITLKYVVNLKAEAIAKVLGMTLDGIDKLLVRARQKIREEKILLEEPDSVILKNRVSIVHKVIYLIYNEGYKSSWGREILREELCEEALIMNKALLSCAIANKETHALHALMLFNASRFKARFSRDGNLLDLEEQDRTLWDKDLITLGSKYLKQSQGNVISSYHLEASIAYLHCIAPCFESTNWDTISNLYRKLLAMNPNPFVELNYAIALYYSSKKPEAFQLLNELQRHPFLNKYYLLSATLGKVNFLEGNYSKAKECFEKTLSESDLPVEKEYIIRQIGKIASLQKK